MLQLTQAGQAHEINVTKSNTDTITLSAGCQRDVTISRDTLKELAAFKPQPSLKVQFYNPEGRAFFVVGPVPVTALKYVPYFLVTAQGDYGCDFGMLKSGWRVEFTA